MLNIVLHSISDYKGKASGIRIIEISKKYLSGILFNNRVTTKFLTKNHGLKFIY